MHYFLFLFMTLTFNVNASQLLHRDVGADERMKDSLVWEQLNLTPFNELIVSWDAQRPKQGHYLISVSLLASEWSSWLDYAFWSAADQHTFKQESGDGLFKVYQDAAEVLKGEKATAFKIRLQALEEADLRDFRTLHVCATDMQTHALSHEITKAKPISLEVSGFSQMALPDERSKRLCSPTSTTAVVNYLNPALHLEPLMFADGVYDTAFYIYGNWILNTAQAAHVLGAPWHCYVARLTSFDAVLDNLERGNPVVVSIRGPLQGSALPYESGHLVVIHGFDAVNKRVLCMDPAFPEDKLTLVSYALDDFIDAWSRRKGVAYLFYK